MINDYDNFKKINVNIDVNSEQVSDVIKDLYKSMDLLKSAIDN